ncbi:MFS transporter [Microvirga pudoricolor]|uniref:MFS transporter n=1 Tax=Microvirga pudoricolor TaxID=2778729 RepID=UPI0019515C9C|nr:MFS transporter [Microvirga pudoricolor]MBM6594475.1 MFS transporter [Microvirga pudoricolor]
MADMTADRTRRSLDAANFFLADVRDGLGPYLAIYLLTVQHWDEATIGLVMSIAGIAGILAQTPAGALIDKTRLKRLVIVVAAAMVTVGSLALPFMPHFLPVAITQGLTGIAGSIFAPALAAVSLGIVGPKAFAKRIGRNEAFNHAGNATAATIAGITAYFFGPIAVFWLMAAMAVASVFAILSIPADAIDHDMARGLKGKRGEDQEDESVSGIKVLLTCRPLLIFAVCAVIFHFANAAMLPLVGQKLALANKNLGTTLMSVCIVAAQVIMVPVAILVGKKADVWGRRPIFLVALGVLALRGALYPVSDNPYWLVGVQALDGIGAGIFGALFPLIISDLTQGTGRFNVSQGIVATAQGIGGALSTTVAGLIVVSAGYSAAFFTLAGIAAVGLVIFFTLMPETKTTDDMPDRTPSGPMPVGASA